MNKRFSTALLSIGLIGGAMGAGNLVANAYDTEDPTPVETTVETDAPEVAPQGLIAQVEGDTPTDAPADSPADGEGRGDRRGGSGGCNNEAVAEVLGLTTDELHAAREAGQSLADVAEDQGIAVDEVIRVIVTEKAEHIAEEVASGEITQADADERLADLEARTAERVNRTPGE
jgi:hypothetical protein